MITLCQFSTSPFAESRFALRRVGAPGAELQGHNVQVHEVARAREATGDYEQVSLTGKFPTIKDGGSYDTLRYAKDAFNPRK